MTHVVTSDHVESLRSGRLVAPGEEVSDTEARQNPKLIDRGVLSERPKAKSTKGAGHADGNDKEGS